MQSTKTSLSTPKSKRYGFFFLLTLCYQKHIFSDLDEKLKSSNGRIKIIVTDGVFSMDGNVAPLDKICELASKYNALTFVDECHATGFFGKTGRFVFHYHKVGTIINE